MSTFECSFEKFRIDLSHSESHLKIQKCNQFRKSDSIYFARSAQRKKIFSDEFRGFLNSAKSLIFSENQCVMYDKIREIFPSRLLPQAGHSLLNYLAHHPASHDETHKIVQEYSKYILYFLRSITHIFDTHSSTSTLECKIVRLMRQAHRVHVGRSASCAVSRKRVDNQCNPCDRVAPEVIDLYRLFYRPRRNPTRNNESQEKFSIINAKFSQIFLPYQIFACMTQWFPGCIENYWRTLQNLYGTIKNQMTLDKKIKFENSVTFLGFF